MILSLVFPIIVSEINFHLKIILEKGIISIYTEINPPYFFNENDNTVYIQTKL